MTPKKRDIYPVFFRLKIKLEAISTQEEEIISFPIFSSSQTIAGKEKLISTYNNLGKQLEDFIEKNFTPDFFSKKFNPHNFIV